VLCLRNNKETSVGLLPKAKCRNQWQMSELRESTLMQGSSDIKIAVARTTAMEASRRDRCFRRGH
jgi:hypothetical protein